MSSYVLSKKPLIRIVFFISVLVLVLSMVLSKYLVTPETSKASLETISAVTFYTGALAVFVAAMSIFSLLILRILEAVGFWTK